ncbi:unnamed protein product [Amoebophrya sp. A25]|nr:unnamed protein product [Amoebophrya sp. A25]|eukprot:GSA25T00016494001.1
MTATLHTAIRDHHGFLPGETCYVYPPSFRGGLGGVGRSISKVNDVTSFLFPDDHQSVRVLLSGVAPPVVGAAGVLFTNDLIPRTCALENSTSRAVRHRFLKRRRGRRLGRKIYHSDSEGSKSDDAGESQSFTCSSEEEFFEYDDYGHGPDYDEKDSVDARGQSRRAGATFVSGSGDEDEPETDGSSPPPPAKTGQARWVPSALFAFAALDAATLALTASSPTSLCDRALRKWLFGTVALGLPTSYAVAKTATYGKRSFVRYRLTVLETATVDVWADMEATQPVTTSKETSRGRTQPLDFDLFLRDAREWSFGEQVMASAVRQNGRVREVCFDRPIAFGRYFLRFNFAPEEDDFDAIFRIPTAWKLEADPVGDSANWVILDVQEEYEMDGHPVSDARMRKMATSTSSSKSSKGRSAAGNKAVKTYLTDDLTFSYPVPSFETDAVKQSSSHDPPWWSYLPGSSLVSLFLPPQYGVSRGQQRLKEVQARRCSGSRVASSRESSKRTAASSSTTASSGGNATTRNSSKTSSGAGVVSASSDFPITASKSSPPSSFIIPPKMFRIAFAVEVASDVGSFLWLTYGTKVLVATSGPACATSLVRQFSFVQIAAAWGLLGAGSVFVLLTSVAAVVLQARKANAQKAAIANE